MVIGTPKEVCALAIMRKIHMKSLKMAVFDDADVTATTHLVQVHLLDQLQDRWEKIMVSSTMKSIKAAPKNAINIFQLSLDHIIPNIRHYIIEIEDSNTKQKAKTIFELLKPSADFSTMIFCNVIIIWLFLSID